MRWWFLLLLLAISGRTLADVQQIAPGTGLQDSVVVDTGANGLCETTAARGDLQAAAVGQGTPNRVAIRCGPNKVVDTTAQGDDVQLVAIGGTCRNANQAVLDTGANGVPETAPVGDDGFAAGVALGIPPANTPCVVAGADGVGQTAAPAGDDVQLLQAGRAAPNTEVVGCGPNGVADTAANNVGAGDDVQLVAVGAACGAGQPVVDSGTDGIATTRAQGPDLRIATAPPVKMTIKRGKPSKTKALKFVVSNVEFGASAPPARGFRIRTTGGSCPGGTVTQVDADPSTPGLQASATVAPGRKAKATLLATVKLEDVITVSAKSPFRCTFNVSAVALDTDPDLDDAGNDEANTTPVQLEVVDENDL